MKIKIAILLTATVLLLCYCKKDDEKTSYIVDDVILSNAQAAVYFHVIFREAENAWAIIDEKGYLSEPVVFESGTTGKKIISFEESGELLLTIEYHTWTAGKVQLMGTMTVILPHKFYPARENKPASIQLSDFSINGQRVIGFASFTYIPGVEGSNDIYNYKLADAAVYDKESPNLKLITADIKNGRYERIEDGDTPINQSDDIWKFTATTTGMLYDDPKMKYTNTILQNNKYILGGDEVSGDVNFSVDCVTAAKGLAEIKIPGWSSDLMLYAYACSDLIYHVQTDVH